MGYEENRNKYLNSIFLGNQTGYLPYKPLFCILDPYAQFVINFSINNVKVTNKIKPNILASNIVDGLPVYVEL